MGKTKQPMDSDGEEESGDDATGGVSEGDETREKIYKNSEITENICDFPCRLSTMSGLASNPPNRQIA